MPETHPPETDLPALLALPETALLKIGEVAQILRIGQSTVFQHVASGDLPAPIRIGKATEGGGADRRPSRWRKTDIDQYLARKVEESTAQTPALAAE